jgi:hypothetical protein
MGEPRDNRPVRLEERFQIIGSIERGQARSALHAQSFARREHRLGDRLQQFDRSPRL